MKINDFKFLGTRFGTTFQHCRLILKTETEKGTKSRFHYLCIQVIENLLEDSVKANVGADGSILEDVLINTIKTTIMVEMNSVKEAAVRMPDSKFALIITNF